MTGVRTFICSYIFFIVFHSLCILPHGSVSDFCPSECNCKWKQGKKTVECLGVNLVDVPDALSMETQVLDLTGNLLQVLPSKAFYKVGLINLQKFFAPRCGIVTIADDAFYQLSILVDLHLSSNLIDRIPAAALRDTPKLRLLFLSFNPIQRIENYSFASLSRLIVLELSNCEIEIIESRAFDGLEKLEYLKLAGNRLRTLPPDTVKLFSTLFVLELHQNPWHCDCHIRRVRELMLLHNIPISGPTRCFEPPKLRGLSWDDVSIDHFSCQEELASTEVNFVETVVTFTEGDNATLTCRVQAVPEGTVKWIWRGREINNLTLISFGRQKYFIREVGTTLKDNSLTIFNVMLEDCGRYMCVSSNKLGIISTNITLNVISNEGYTDAQK